MKEVEVSLVIPCLNEARTIASCINKAKLGFSAASVSSYEIIVADNGSSDDSISLAKSLGARVVEVEAKGYGAALAGGIDVALGKFIIMGDGDDSYDFSSISGFISALRNGFDLVVGDRFKGKIMPEAMPGAHKFGNPFFSFLGRIFFNSKIGDFYCGLRGFSKEAWRKLDLQTSGMEYAIEMIAKASLLEMKITSVPITLFKDGRGRKPHLKTWRDGWRTLRFMLLFTPQWLFFLPGILLLIFGVVFFSLSIFSLRIFEVRFELHTLLVSCLSMVVGVQVILFGIFSEVLVSRFNLIPRSKKIISAKFNLEYGLLAGVIFMLSGLAILFFTFLSWSADGFADLEYGVTMRAVIPSVFLIQLGIQLLFNSFFLGILKLPRKDE